MHVVQLICVPDSMVKHVDRMSKKLDECRSVSNAACVKNRFYSTSPSTPKRNRTEITPNSSVEEIFAAIQEHMKRNRMTVMDLFGTADRPGNGGVSAFRLREILQTEELGLSQRQITCIIRAIDSEEDGTITPIAFETVLRRVRWGQQAMHHKSPQPYKSPRGANAKPVVNNFKTKTKNVASEQKIDELFDHQAQNTMKVLDSELALRDNLFRVIVKRVRDLKVVVVIDVDVVNSACIEPPI